MVLSVGIEHFDIDLAAASHSAKLIPHLVFHVVNRELAFQNRFHAGTFVIEIVRPVLGLTGMVFVRDFPRDAVARAFTSFEELAITSASGAAIAWRTIFLLSVLGVASPQVLPSQISNARGEAKVGMRVSAPRVTANVNRRLADIRSSDCLTVKIEIVQPERP